MFSNQKPYKIFSILIFLRASNNRLPQTLAKPLAFEDYIYDLASFWSDIMSSFLKVTFIPPKG